MYRSPLESWTNEQGTFVLIEDPCHPMLPYLAQGVHPSIEDGSVLGRLLECLDSKDHLRQRIKLYERLRKARSEAIVFRDISSKRCVPHARRQWSQAGLSGPGQSSRPAWPGLPVYGLVVYHLPNLVRPLVSGPNRQAGKGPRPACRPVRPFAIPRMV
jgi:hypothetical protein